jgi:hypothetical protein
MSAGVVCPDAKAARAVRASWLAAQSSRGDSVGIAEVQVVPHLHVPDGCVDDTMFIEATLPFLELMP